MKRATWYLGLLLVGTLLFVGGCTEEPSPPVPPVVPVTPTGYSDVCIPIGEFQSGHQHIDVVMSTVLGGELTVTLGSNPTTGFQWSEEAEISDETIVQQTSHIFVGPGIEKPPGTPVKRYGFLRHLREGLLPYT